MIKVDKLKVEMDGNAAQIAKELCYGLVALRFRILDEAEEHGTTEEHLDSCFKMMMLGGIANCLSDDGDGFISEELVAKKLSEIAKRAYAETKDERSWREVLN